MLPHLGAGGGVGIEDAYVLSQLLGHPLTNASNVEVRFQTCYRLLYNCQPPITNSFVLYCRYMILLTHA
jgi:hypothetical protein